MGAGGWGLEGGRWTRWTELKLRPYGVRGFVAGGRCFSIASLLYESRATGDTVGMNGTGVGASVGLGALIGLVLVAPGVQFGEYLATTAFWSIFAYAMFEGVKALFFWKPPGARTPRP